MQSQGLPAVELEKKLIHSASRSVLFGAVIADSLEQALAVERRLTNLPAVASVDLGGIENMTRYLTEDQTRKLALVRVIREVASAIHFQPPDPRPVDVRELARSLWIFRGYLTAAAKIMGQQGTATPSLEDAKTLRQLTSLGDAASLLRDQILQGDKGYVAAQLGAFQRALFDDVRETFHIMQNQDASARLTVRDLPDTLRKRFVGVNGRYLLQVYPRKDVWNRANQKEFVEQLRRIDPDVTGTPVQLYEYTTLLKNSYQQAAGYSLIAIVILVLAHFRSLLCVILALLPVAIGSLWMTGFMGLFEIPFNPANIMTLPLVIGVGVTNGIHILNRFAEEQSPSILAKSTGRAVLVSGLTTIAGFGSLIIAKHRGIASLGAIMAVGTLTCLLAGLTFLPALLRLMAQRGWTIKKPSGDNALPHAGSGGTEDQT